MSTRRRKQAQVAEIPARYAGVWFGKHFVNIGFIKGRVTKYFPLGHPIKLEDLFEISYVDGDSEKVSTEELDELIKTGSCDPATKAELEEEQAIRADRMAPASSSHAATASASAAEDGGTDGEGALVKKRSKTPKATTSTSETKKSKRKSKKASASASSSSAAATDEGGSASSLVGNADSWYGETYKVDKILDRKYEASLKYKVRWKGKWPPEEKETWEDAAHLNPRVTEKYEKSAEAETTPVVLLGDEAEEFSRLRENNLKLMSYLKIVLRYLEPPTWQENHTPIEELTADDFLDFPVSEFLREYSSVLNDYVAGGEEPEQEQEQEQEQGAEEH